MGWDSALCSTTLSIVGCDLTDAITEHSAVLMMAGAVFDHHWARTPDLRRQQTPLPPLRPAPRCDRAGGDAALPSLPFSWPLMWGTRSPVPV